MVPEPDMFSSALQQLGVTPSQVEGTLRYLQHITGQCFDVSVVLQAVWLDVDEDGVKAARTAGMDAILVDDLGAALGKLGDFDGVQVRSLD